MAWTTDQKIRISLVDDQRMFRHLLSASLMAVPEFHFLHSYSDGNSFLKDLAEEQTRPDIAIIDVDMPHMNGIQLNEKLREEFPDIKVMVLSMHRDEEIISQLINSGAASYLLKDSSIDELQLAIHSIYKTGFYFNSHILNSLQAKKGSKRNSANPEGITTRELEVLEYICKELTNAEIAEKLNISIRTVDSHRKSLLAKTHSKNTAGLVLYAIKHHLIEP